MSLTTIGTLPFELNAAPDGTSVALGLFRKIRRRQHSDTSTAWVVARKEEVRTTSFQPGKLASTCGYSHFANIHLWNHLPERTMRAAKAGEIGKACIDRTIGDDVQLEFKTQRDQRR